MFGYGTTLLAKIYMHFIRSVRTLIIRNGAVVGGVSKSFRGWTPPVARVDNFLVWMRLFSQLCALVVTIAMLVRLINCRLLLLLLLFVTIIASCCCAAVWVYVAAPCRVPRSRDVRQGASTGWVLGRSSMFGQGASRSLQIYAQHFYFSLEFLNIFSMKSREILELDF